MSRTCLSAFTLFCCLLICLLIGAPVNAQNIYASLTGTVTDQTRAIVPGATIPATNNDKGFKRSATANNASLFGKVTAAQASRQIQGRCTIHSKLRVLSPSGGMSQQSRHSV